MLISGAAAAGAYPSGFDPAACEYLLRPGATVPNVTAFKKTAVRGKVREIHEMAHALATSTAGSDSERMDQVVNDLLSTAAFSTFGPRLQIVAEIERSWLLDFADELREISFSLFALAVVADYLPARFAQSLLAYSKLVVELPYRDGHKISHNWRALTFLTLALLESQQALRDPSPAHLLRGSLENLRSAEVEDARGDRGDVAFSGLAEVCDRIIARAPDLSADDLEALDEDASDLFESLTADVTTRATKPPHFVELAQGLVDTEGTITAEELPLLAHALARFVENFTTRQSLN